MRALLRLLNRRDESGESLLGALLAALACLGVMAVLYLDLVLLIVWLGGQQ